MDTFKFHYLGLSVLVEIILIIESTKGTPANTIQGTNEMVSKNVLWYNGKTDKDLPNR
jgi:hypothetical protein